MKDRIEPLDYPYTLTTCEYHQNQKLKALKDETHPRHEEYPLFDCHCPQHKEMQQRWIEQAETDVRHPEHGLRGECMVLDCNKCIDSEDDYQELPDSQDVSSTEHPNHGNVHWTFCYNDDCPIHLQSKEAGYFPRIHKRLRATIRKDMKEEWICIRCEQSNSGNSRNCERTTKNGKQICNWPDRHTEAPENEYRSVDDAWDALHQTMGEAQEAMEGMLEALTNMVRKATGKPEQKERINEDLSKLRTAIHGNRQQRDPETRTETTDESGKDSAIRN